MLRVVLIDWNASTWTARGTVTYRGYVSQLLQAETHTPRLSYHLLFLRVVAKIIAFTPGNPFSRLSENTTFCAHIDTGIFLTRPLTQTLRLGLHPNHDIHVTINVFTLRILMPKREP